MKLPICESHNWLIADVDADNSISNPILLSVRSADQADLTGIACYVMYVCFCLGFVMSCALPSHSFVVSLSI